ncbi:gamma-glutamylcyclotransferase family protein [Thalassotalea mangrovi]|uniref:Gamma-glutamylcyclotransferase n=1 Tax=Thalassotalea mangrovi TaxID=2572245 RepID=A0A4U1B3F7_9GAMM|nr:gamma-glutamylcyclotransferase family protein [Thalassotalea mangrovi]TKB44003.1 gamma-glutamylcyclotransferase [Thalassotalea mangrovi]
MYYFAYGSNMSLARLTARVPSAIKLGCYTLEQHELRFHKASHDGSGKCDAFYTSNSKHFIHGALYRIDPEHKADLDKVEGLGKGYNIKTVRVVSDQGHAVNAFTYVATHIDHSLAPYSWYLNHVLIGAWETKLPQTYIKTKISAINAIEDHNLHRDKHERAIHQPE